MRKSLPEDLPDRIRFSPPIWAAATGRWVATSITRYLDKVSLEANRENEGPYQTRLFTNMSDVKPSRSTSMANPEKAIRKMKLKRKLKRRIQCECMGCVYFLAFETVRQRIRKYIRQIYNNESIVVGGHSANKMINSCSLCGLCEELCPENLAMQDVDRKYAGAWSYEV